LTDFVTASINYTKKNYKMFPTTRHRRNLWSVGPDAKPRRWAPLTRGTRKGIKRV